MTRLSVSQLRAELSTAVNRVAFGKEHIVIHRQGRDVVAIVPLEDLELLDQIEDRLLLEEARTALEDPENQDRIPWEQVKAELGL
jgi:prevent-host-death family protein